MKLKLKDPWTRSWKRCKLGIFLSPILLELFMGAGRQNFSVTNRKQFQSYRAHPTPNDVVKNTPLGKKNTPLIVTVTDVLQKCISLYIHTSWHCDFAAPPIKKWSLHMTLIYYCVSYTSIEKKKGEILSPAK